MAVPADLSALDDAIEVTLAVVDDFTEPPTVTASANGLAVTVIAGANSQDGLDCYGAILGAGWRSDGPPATSSIGREQRFRSAQ